MAENYKYLFYSVIGTHDKESPKEILVQKLLEISKIAEKDENKFGYTLWAATIPDKPTKIISGLDEKTNIVVLAKISKGARDPVPDIDEISKCNYSHEDNNPNSCRATYMYSNGKVERIPDEIKTTYQKNETSNKRYNIRQAYKVKTIKILDKPLDYDFSKYQYTKKTNRKTKTFYEEFDVDKNTWFQNRFGVRNEEINGQIENNPPIHVIMELAYPYVVDIIDAVNMEEAEKAFAKYQK